MNKLMATDVKMTSLDIAEITGKEHKNVMRDIRNEIKDLGKENSLLIFEPSTYTNERGREYDSYTLNKKGAMQLALKYDAKTRYQVIKKIEELESNANRPSYMIDDPIKRAEQWIVEQKEVRLLEQENNEMKPKATYHDAVLQSETLLTTTSIAKDLGMGAPTLNKLLHELDVQYKRSGRWYLYHKYQDKGYTQSKTHLVAAGKTKETMYWTQKGKQFIFGLLEKMKGIIPVSKGDAS